MLTYKVFLFLNSHLFNITIKEIISESLPNLHNTNNSITLKIDNKNSIIQKRLFTKIQITITAEKENIKNALINYKKNIEEKYNILHTEFNFLKHHNKLYNIQNIFHKLYTNTTQLVNKVEELYSDKYYNFTFLYESQIKDLIFNSVTKTKLEYLIMSLSNMVRFVKMINDELSNDIKNNVVAVHKVLKNAKNNNLIGLSLFTDLTVIRNEILNIYYEKLMKIIISETKELMSSINGSNNLFLNMNMVLVKYCSIELLQNEISNRLVYLIGYKNKFN